MFSSKKFIEFVITCKKSLIENRLLIIVIRTQQGHVMDLAQVGMCLVPWSCQVLNTFIWA